MKGKRWSRWSHQRKSQKDEIWLQYTQYTVSFLISSALFLTNAVAVPIPTLSVSTSWSHLTHLMLTRLMSTRHTWHILLVLRQAGKQHQEFDSLGWGVETPPSTGRLGRHFRPSLTSYHLFHRFMVHWWFIQLHHSNFFNGRTRMTNPEPDTTERSSTQSPRHRRQLQRVVEALTSPEKTCCNHHIQWQLWNIYVNLDILRNAAMADCITQTQMWLPRIANQKLIKLGHEQQCRYHQQKPKHCCNDIKNLWRLRLKKINHCKYHDNVYLPVLFLFEAWKTRCLLSKCMKVQWNHVKDCCKSCCLWKALQSLWGALDCIYCFQLYPVHLQCPPVHPLNFLPKTAENPRDMCEISRIFVIFDKCTCL